MTIETATYISSLNSANPGASDAISEGDDHIRLLKSTIKATFPNVAGAATPSHTELNYVTGVTSAIQTQINAKAPSVSPTFTTPALGTPASGVLTNCTGTASGLTAGLANALAAGAAGQLPYQSGSGTTAFSAAGTAGQTLQSGGTGSPTWVTVSNSPIVPITATASLGAMTVTINPTVIDFRSSTVLSGTVNTRTIAAAISVVAPSTSTLGAVATVPARIAVLAIDNAGTVEVAIINVGGGVDLSETGVISTTAISTGSTSATVAYSTTARTSVAYRVVGYLDTTQAVSGTWVNPTVIQGAGGQAFTANHSAGQGQTYKLNGTDITRAVSTTYYNTTGKPITVVCAFEATGGTTGNIYTVTATVGGKAVPLTTMTQGYAVGGGTFIVPVGMAYSITVGTTATIRGWSELS